MRAGHPRQSMTDTDTETPAPPHGQRDMSTVAADITETAGRGVLTDTAAGARGVTEEREETCTERTTDNWGLEMVKILFFGL